MYINFSALRIRLKGQPNPTKRFIKDYHHYIVTIKVKRFMKMVTAKQIFGGACLAGILYLFSPALKEIPRGGVGAKDGIDYCVRSCKGGIENIKKKNPLRINTPFTMKSDDGKATLELLVGGTKRLTWDTGNGIFRVTEDDGYTQPDKIVYIVDGKERGLNHRTDWRAWRKATEAFQGYDKEAENRGLYDL